MTCPKPCPNRHCALAGATLTAIFGKAAARDSESRGHCNLKLISGTVTYPARWRRPARGLVPVLTGPGSGRGRRGPGPGKCQAQAVPAASQAGDSPGRRQVTGCHSGWPGRASDGRLAGVTADVPVTQPAAGLQVPNGTATSSSDFTPLAGSGAAAAAETPGPRRPGVPQCRGRPGCQADRDPGRPPGPGVDSEVRWPGCHPGPDMSPQCQAASPPPVRGPPRRGRAGRAGPAAGPGVPVRGWPGNLRHSVPRDSRLRVTSGRLRVRDSP
jgi:hypothetical protein